MKITFALFFMLLAAFGAKADEMYNIDHLKELYDQKKFIQVKPGFAALASENDPEALYYIGLMNFRGEGGARNYPYAFTRFEKAGVFGHGDALFMQGMMHLWGIGTDEDFRGAYIALSLADKLGNTKAVALLPFSTENYKPTKDDEYTLRYWKPKDPKNPTAATDKRFRKAY